MKDTLLLNADFTPLQIVDWQRAVWLVLSDRVFRVDDYGGLVVRSASLRVPWPAVIALTRQTPLELHAIALSRASILARDAFTCQYCGWCATSRAGRPVTDPLTIDHVVPRAHAVHGRVQLADGRQVSLHSWENTTTACRTCNHHKGARTPDQAAMPLRSTPRPPGPTEAVRITFAKVEVESEWAPFLPAGTGVRRARRSAA